MSAALNPYEAPAQPTGSDRASRIFRHALAASPSLAPSVTLISVVSVVVLERDLKMRGAILGSFETPMSVLFTFSALMTFSFVLWVPVGLGLAILLSLRLQKPLFRLAYPLLFIICTLACVAFAITDLDGMWTYYLD